MRVLSRAAVPVLLLASLLGGCATTSDGTAPLNQRTWPVCSLLGGLVGGGLGAIESGSWAAGGAALGILAGGLICYAHDGDEDGDGVPDSRDKCPGTPKGTPVDANGCPPPVPVAVIEEVVVVKEETIVVRDVHFEFDSAKLTAADKTKLDMIATRLKQENASAQLRVTGHTDSVGSDSYNLKLSEKRAHSVVEYLIQSGVPRSSFVSVSGAGESHPVADNKTADGRALNRRTEINIKR